MNIFDAIRYVEKTKNKVKTQEGHELGYSLQQVRLLFPCGNSVCNHLLLTTILQLEHLDFKPVTDWSKVKDGARVIVKAIKEKDKARDNNKRHFAEFKDGLVGTYAAGYTAWTNNIDVIFWDPNDVELVEETE